jgi:hypothetical protein
LPASGVANLDLGTTSLLFAATAIFDRAWLLRPIRQSIIPREPPLHVFQPQSGLHGLHFGRPPCTYRATLWSLYHHEIALDPTSRSIILIELPYLCHSVLDGPKLCHNHSTSEERAFSRVLVSGSRLYRPRIESRHPLSRLCSAQHQSVISYARLATR